MTPRTPSHRKAKGTDESIKASHLRRLARIEGQIRGIAKMVEEERYCADVLAQVSSAQQALGGVAQELMRNHLKHCARAAFEEGPKEREAMVNELLELMDLKRRFG